MSTNLKPQSPWSKTRNWIVGLTGVLLVVPALINSGIDVYAAWKKIPRTDAERANIELFKKYFGKSPVAILPVPIKNGPATYEVKFSVYEEGDVFVEYGTQTQWFPFPRPTATSTALLSPIANANAQDLSALYGPYQQQDSFQGYLLFRNRQYASGATEQQVIDMRTGQIVSLNVTPPRPPANSATPQAVAPFAGIDLNAPQYAPPAVPQAAFSCMSQAGMCRLFQPIPRGAQCYCLTPYGPAFGQAN